MKNMDDSGLVYIGQIISLDHIEGADFILSATVICGKGGKWRGVVRKSDFVVGSFCTVFLPDSLLDKDKHSYLPYMEKTKWRVRMCRFKGAPSEVLITKCDAHTYNDSTEQLWDIGLDVTYVSSFYDPNDVAFKKPTSVADDAVFPPPWNPYENPEKTEGWIGFQKRMKENPSYYLGDYDE